ncbi:MAG: hypothetical protein AB3K77_07175 [Methanosarcinaceae archaeon]
METPPFPKPGYPPFPEKTNEIPPTPWNGATPFLKAVFERLFLLRIFLSGEITNRFRQEKSRIFPNFHINIFIQKTPEYHP